MNTDATIDLRLSIPQILFSSLIENPNTLIDLFSDPQINRLKAFLFDQLKDKDGSPEIGEFRISGWTYNEQHQTGTFRLHFTINRRFCCSDIEGCNSDYIDFDFDYVHEEFNASAHYFNWMLDN